MKVYNKGRRGIHEREIVGINRLVSELPDDWILFTNLELALPTGGREIDAIIVGDDRIYVVDLKDWHGKITSGERGWLLNGKFMEGGNPYEKIADNRRELQIRLREFIKQQGAKFSPALVNAPAPHVEHGVILTGSHDRSGLGPTEKDRVYPIDFFTRTVRDWKLRKECFAGALPIHYDPGLIRSPWVDLLKKFFNVDTNYFRLSSRHYGPWVPKDDHHIFAHGKGIFSEYSVSNPSAGDECGLLRRWDFTKAEARFQNEQARTEIAGREQKVINWLKDRNPDIASGVLQPRDYDQTLGLDYWDVFERRRRLKRLQDLSADRLAEMSRDNRIELVRQIVLRVRQMHDVGAAHLDIGPHSVWVEAPSIAQLSHLLAASFPEVASLGQARYQFLSSVVLPEDAFDNADSSQRKDVYLLGCVAHYLLLSCLPRSKDGVPADWDPALDPKGTMQDLHPWLARALQLDPMERFVDAGEMLEELNRALSSQPSVHLVLKELERFQTIRSLKQLLKTFPEEEELCDDSRVAMWTSEFDGRMVLVKIWKREGWGDHQKEAPRLLGFLEQAEALRADQPAGCASIVDRIWIPEGLVLVQEYLPAPTLTTTLAQVTHVLQEPTAALNFVRSLCRTVVALHGRETAHGDLKPDNILVVEQSEQSGEDSAGIMVDGPRPVLIDLLDYSPAEDGERMNTAYSPPTGGRFERDRFAVTKIAEEVLTSVEIDAEGRARLGHATNQIRTASPANATLLPLLEAIEFCLEPPPAKEQRTVVLVLPSESDAPFDSDEGKISLTLARNGQALYLRGVYEEITVALDGQFRPLSARRHPIDEGLLNRQERFTFVAVTMTLVVRTGADPDLSALKSLLADSDVAPAWQAECDEAMTRLQTAARPAVPEAEEENEETAGDESELSGEAAEDQLIEEVAQQNVIDQSINVPKLWTRLLELEADLIISGTAISPSYFNEQTQRHHVEFQLESGTFEFARDDRVNVSRLNRQGNWVRVGPLDLAVSSPSHLQIMSRRRTGEDADALVEDGQLLRLESHFEVTSRQRRREATDRVLARESRIQNLIDVLHPKKALTPVTQACTVDRMALMKEYGLNAVQAEAFAKLIAQRPVGLLQGPPGTGKTRFIGALVHYVLKNNLAKNVLLASQSHEAVNGAAEAVLGLFKHDENMPSMLRVGHEGIVSEMLLPYHAARVEGLIKDRFKAELRPRLHVAARALGLPDTLAEKLIVVEAVIRPMIERILKLQELEINESIEARINTLLQTLESVVDSLELEATFEHAMDDQYLPDLANAVAADQSFGNAATVNKFLNVAELARDFIGSVSSRERGFETFLAGTRRIVAGTCVGLGRASLGLTSTPFDLVIVDEAARCTPGELAVPLQSGRWAVLVGDHRQLEPTHPVPVVRQVARELHVSAADVKRSDFERVFNSAYGRTGGTSLTEQYRMLPPIGEIVSNVFYRPGLGHGLTHGRTDHILTLDTMPVALQKPLTWITTDAFGPEGFQRDASKGRSVLHNPAELELIVGLLKEWDSDQQLHRWIDAHSKSQKAIGIICTYREQSKLLQASVKRANLSPELLATIKIDTVDSYQGKENVVVILSLTRNNEEGPIEDGVATIREGFMAQPNRLNVAMSRARDRLVLVGAARRWPQKGPMAAVEKEFALQVDAGQAEWVDGRLLKAEFDAPLQKVTSKHDSAALAEAGDVK
ncbi:AAA domain-containing protein [Cupriavidus basilensis]